MLVQALADYADTRLPYQLTDEAFEEKPVPYFIELDRQGAFLNITSNTVSAVRGKKTVSVSAPLVVARSPVPRNAGLYPLLAADDIKYVMGLGSWTAAGQEDNNRERHEAFVVLIGQAARDTEDEGLQACANFYRRPDQVESARSALAGAKPGSMIALSLEGPVIKRSAAREYWRTHYRTSSSGRIAKGGDVECLISGRIGPIAPTHEKIKGLASLGGQSSGVSLMSFDKEAFRSYGWEQNANSPVSPDRAMAYVLALNDLLRRDRGQRRDISGVGFLFWTKKQEEFDPMSTLDYPEPSQIQRFLQLDPLADPDPNMFYMAGICGNGGRMLIRYWVVETLADVKKNMRNWFEGLRVADAFSGAVGLPPRLWELRHAIDREGEPPADRVVALVRRAIEGPAQPLGYRMLSAALTRLRASSGTERLKPARVGLIRLCLNDLISRRKEPRFMTASLDPGDRHPAYLSGRLLAVYESLQYAVNKSEVNQTVTDRYYSLASTYPALAFQKLDNLGQKHLSKLRRENPGARVRIQQEIDSLCGEIAAACGFRFPPQLDLDGQGRFVLGYHYQRAHNMAQAQAKKNKPTSNQESETQEEPNNQ
jgi:CRISPR-associated protein Csd1